MKQCFKSKRFGADALARIAVCNAVVERYQKQNLRLTLRQLYYQLVTQNVIPNEEKSYKTLGKLLSDARLAGLVDWDAIEDRVRQPRVPQDFKSIEELVDVALLAYRLPRWAGQENYVELWVEKDALAGVLQPVADRWHITLMVNRGYCVSPETKILTSDLRWVQAGDVEVGARLIGVDEVPPAYRKHRKMHETQVTSVCRFVSDRVRVVTDYGDIIVSANHPFLTTKMTKLGDNWHGYLWTEAAKLQAGYRIARLTEPWPDLNSRDAGWLAGMYDGEGCLPLAKLAREIDLYQKPGPVLDEARRVMRSLGLPFADFERPQSGTRGQVASLRTYSIEHVLRLLGQLRPLRLLQSFRIGMQRGTWPAKSKSPATVLAVEPMIPGGVIGVETQHKTLVTNGLISHNSSTSAMYESAQRFLEASDKQPVLLYLGDHDPSGEDMVRDVKDRLKLMGIDDLEVRKLALTMDQVERFNPPPNPAKLSDSRARAYVTQHGASSWEVDALQPEVLQQIIETAIRELVDVNAMNAIKAQEEQDKDRLRKATRRGR